MGSIDIIKPLFTVLSSDINESQQHQEKNSWKPQESNPGLWMCSQNTIHLCYADPYLANLILSWVWLTAFWLNCSSGIIAVISWGVWCWCCSLIDYQKLVNLICVWILKCCWSVSISKFWDIIINACNLEISALKTLVPWGTNLDDSNYFF